MTHAHNLPTTSPVYAAIAAHRAAYDTFQVAPEGKASERAAYRYDDASMALTAVLCSTPAEAVALFRHLVWWLGEEAEYADGHQPAYSIALARARDLSLLLASMTRPTPIPQAMPSGRIAARIPRRAVPLIDLRPRSELGTPNVLSDDAPYTVAEWEAVTPVRPDTAHVRALRFMELAGEALTTVIIIAGGIAAYGYLPLA